MSYLFGHREDLFNNNWDLIQLLIDGVKGEEFSNYNGYKLIKYDGKFYVVKGKSWWVSLHQKLMRLLASIELQAHPMACRCDIAPHLVFF